YLNVATGPQSGTEFDLTIAYQITSAFILGLNAADFTAGDGFGYKGGFSGVAIYPALAVIKGVTLGLRGEYFKTKTGSFYTAGPLPGESVTGITFTANVKAGPLTFIPEIRFDNSSKNDLFVDGNNNYTTGATQFLLAAVFYIYSMKYLIPVFLFLLITKTAAAQQDLLSFDEHNKYIYYQVETMPGIPADTLMQRGLKFLKAAYPKTTVKQDNAVKTEGVGKFLVYGGLSVLKHEKGEIAYQLNIEYKDQKYRFWVTGFV